MTEPGELAIVLHTHMPYVEGYGTWPFGEEWLWEAAATSYVPVMDLLERLGPDRTRRELTLSVTPVLADQLTAEGVQKRCVDFLRSVREQSHRLDIEGFRAAGDAEAVRELELSARDYARAADWIERNGLWNTMQSHATWTSSATHAILPLLMLDDSVNYQIHSGIEAFRQRAGKRDQRWEGGFWLPECAYVPRLGPTLRDAGVKHTCLELTELLGRGDQRHLTPIQDPHNPVIWPIDRAVVDLVWGPAGYPAAAAYRDYHRRSVHDHHVWANDGSHYDRKRAAAHAREDARAFVAAVKQRVSTGGVCVFAIDTELLGHWWYEGPQWLEAVIQEADAQSLTLTALDDGAADRHPPVRAKLPADMAPVSWGSGNDLRTWGSPKVAGLAWQARSAELRTFLGPEPPNDRAVRELLALQSSDWAFLADREWAADYPELRAAGHQAALDRALNERIPPDSDAGAVRGLAPWLAK